MYGTTPLIIIFIPILFQIIYGRKAIGEDIKLKLSQICWISFTSHIVISFISFEIASYNYQKKMHGQPYHCGPGLLGIIGLDVLLMFFLLIVMIIQYFIWKSYEKQ